VKKPFHDPIAPKSKHDGEYPWEFKAPSYDNRTSYSISAGDNYGVGFRTPVGKEKASPITSGPIPQKAKCFSPDDVMMNDIEG
jgi:hypothetical protein